MKSKIWLYVYEALGLGIFMISAGFFAALIDHPAMPVRAHIPNDLLRRFIIGLSMGLTAYLIIHSSFGKKSGAHINPSVTIVQYRLGNINRTDALLYILFQFIGAAIGLLIIYLFMPYYISTPPIDYIVTKPYHHSVMITFLAEFIISFILITVVLYSNTSKKLSKHTATFVAILITLFITFEAPFSGMSMNPARTFGSAIIANEWPSFWIYCMAPPLGMITGQYFVGKILNKDLKNVTLQNDKSNKHES